MIDQMLLSGLNFLIGLVLIRFATKETYGLYSQLFGVSVLAASLLDATIGSALTTLIARRSEAERQGFVARTFRLQMVASGVFALVCGLGILGLAKFIELTDNAEGLALAFAVFIFALSCREYCRTAFFVEARPETVAVMDMFFVALTLLGGSVIFFFDQVTVISVICLLALTNLLSAAMYGRQLFSHTNAAVTWENCVHDARALWSLGRWALIGASVAWLVNSGYLYFAGGFMGAAALADLNAARLLLIPISLVAVAWSRVARPTIGKFVAEADWPQQLRFLLRSTVVMECFALGYVAVLFFGFPWLSTHVLGEKYQHVSGLLLLWGLYFAINCARGVGTTSLVSFGAFRALFWQGLGSAVILTAGCLLVIPHFGVHGALMAMITVELFELVINWCYLLPRARQKKLLLE